MRNSLIFSLILSALSVSAFSSGLGQAAGTGKELFPAPNTKQTGTTTPKGTQFQFHPSEPKKKLPVTDFEIIARQGKLFLTFVSRNPQLELSRDKNIVIQLMTPPPLDVTPSFITQKTWPKNTKEIPLTLKGSVKKGASITGGAAYSVCKHGSQKDCQRVKTPILYQLQ